MRMQMVPSFGNQSGCSSQLNICFHVCGLGYIQLFVTPWGACRLLCPWDSPGKTTGVGGHVLLQGNLPKPGIKPTSPVSLALVGRFSTTETPGKPA